jgi:hypothetical protein
MVAAGYPDEHKTRVTVSQGVMLGVPFTLLAGEKGRRYIPDYGLAMVLAPQQN